MKVDIDNRKSTGVQLLNDEHIAEIAELLQCEMQCYFHKPSGSIEHHPEIDEPDFDPEPWQDVIDKIENDPDNYIKFEKMSSSRAYSVMEDFANSLNNEIFKSKLLYLLSRSKPFARFKNAIDFSEYRQDWFGFKKYAYIEWVKKQIE